MENIRTNTQELLAELLESGQCQAREGSDYVSFVEENENGKWYKLCDFQGTVNGTSTDPEFLIEEMVYGEVEFMKMVQEEE